MREVPFALAAADALSASEHRAGTDRLCHRQRTLGERLRAGGFGANFGQDREIGERAVVAEILTDLGQPAETLLVRAEASPERGALRATALGIFGAPNCWVKGEELFWGEEALEDAVAWAGSRHDSSDSRIEVSR